MTCQRCGDETDDYRVLCPQCIHEGYEQLQTIREQQRDSGQYETEDE